MYRLLVIWAGKIILNIGRLRGGGSALPGLIVEKLYPNFIKESVKQLTKGSILVTGTNGKTTTTKMIAKILEDQGNKVLVNSAGSNMPRGVIAGILNSMDWRGHVKADTALFEVDEGFIPAVSAACGPKAIVVLNLLRDQLDRYGELARTATLIEQALGHTQISILNGDDPLVANLSVGEGKALFFGAVSNIQTQVPHDDALHQKTQQILSSKVKPAVTLTALKPAKGSQAVKVSVAGKSYSLNLRLLGAYNAYNAAAALLLAHSLGIKTEEAIKSVEKVEPAFGRSELITIGGKQVRLLLVKNPAGFNQTIETFLVNNSSAPVLIAINDNYADGRDVSWLWDVNIERLSGSPKTFYTTGIRAEDMSLRLQYADIKSQANRNIQESLEEFIQKLPEGVEGYIVPTYTAMLAIRKLLAKQTKMGGIWE